MQWLLDIDHVDYIAHYAAVCIYLGTHVNCSTNVSEQYSFKHPNFNSIFTSSRGRWRLSKDEQVISAHFDTLIIEIHARDMIISMLVDQVWKSLLTGFKRPWQQPILRVSSWPSISNLQVVVWLLLLWISTQRSLNNSFYLISSFIIYWLPWSVT